MTLSGPEIPSHIQGLIYKCEHIHIFKLYINTVYIRYIDQNEITY